MSGGHPASHFFPREFAPSNWDRWRWRRSMRMSHADRALTLLKQIESDASTEEVANATWLLKYRAELKWAIQFALVEPIKLYLSDCPPQMIPLGVWLWGKCADRFRLYGLSAFCNDPSPKVRKHLAKALRRVEAWALLNEMAANYPEEAKIQCFATKPTTHGSFAERLKNFTSRVDDSRAGEVATPSRMPFWAQESFWTYTPPKSVLTIRRMLRRIRHWVRWGVS